MLKMIQGAKINDADKLNEEFEITEKRLNANVDSDKIKKIIDDFIEVQEGYLFLIIEIPTSRDDAKTYDELFGKDVYYQDGMTKEQIREFFHQFGNLFINDGMSQVGVGNHQTKCEIMKEKYNVVSIYFGNDEKSKYEEIFVKNKIKKVEELTTAWKYFTKSNYGESSIIRKNGKTVYDVVEMLKKNTKLYFAERRSDD